MLDKTQYSSWEILILLYIKGKENVNLLVDSVLNGPFKYGTVTDAGTETTLATIRDRRYDELTDAEKIQAKHIWDRVKLLTEGFEILLQEGESKLYDEFDMFTSVLRDTIHLYHLRFAQLINNMHTIRMIMRPIQVNTKFINHLQPEWSKFVTDVKLVKDLNNPNFDQLYAYLRQHEAHAEEVRLVVPSFLPSNDPIVSLNKAMTFISTAFTSRYPLTNNQLRTSANPRNQATIQDGRVQVQTVQGIQNQGYAGSGARSNVTATRVNKTGRTNIVGQAKVIRCYNRQEEGHMARQCTKPKRPRNSTWFKEKVMLTEALELGVVLDEEQMAFLADMGIYDVLMAKLSPYDSTTLLEIHSLKQQLNATVESHKTLSTTVDVLKMKSKAKEDKYLDEIIELEKQKKALDNVIYKMGQLTQTMHMFSKPQAFYNETHKIALGYQNPLYLSQAQRKVPALYCGYTIVKPAALSVIDTKETLELAEESRLKMHAKQNDPIVKEKKVNIAPIDYVALNK
ncbi:hypothetical protein Tco_0562395 [Tanacetum coccineum]